MAKKTEEGFTAAEEVFIQALIDHPNATRAYLLAHPGVKATTAAVEGSRLLRKPKIAEKVKTGRRERIERLKLDGDEAMARIATVGRQDIRLLFDHEGKMLPITEWPEELALTVKSIEEKRNGTKVTFDSRLAALELIAAADGKLVREVKVTSTLADMLAELAKPEDVVLKKGAK